MQTEEDIGSCEAGVTGNCEKVDIGAGNGSTVVGKSKHFISPSLQTRSSGLSHLLLHLIL